jgi:hypothetical protein
MSKQHLFFTPAFSGPPGPRVSDAYSSVATSSWEYGAGLTGEDGFLGVTGSAYVVWESRTQKLNLQPGEYFLNSLQARVAFTEAADNDQQMFVVYEKSGSNLIEVTRLDVTSQKSAIAATHNHTYQLGGLRLVIEAAKEYHFALAMRGAATRAFGRPGIRFKTSGWAAQDERAGWIGTTGVGTLPTTITPTFVTDGSQVCYILSFSTRNRILFSGSATSKMIPRRTDGVTTIKIDTFVGDATTTNINLMDTAATRLATVINHTGNDLSFAGTAQTLTGQQGNTFDFLIQVNGTAANLLYQNRTNGQGGQGVADPTTISHRARNTSARGGSYTMGFASWRYLTTSGGGTISLIELGWEPIVIFGDSMSSYSGRLGQYLPPAFTYPRIDWRASISGNALTTTSPGNHTAGHLRYKSATAGTGDLCEIRDSVFCFGMYGLNDISRIGTNSGLIPTVTTDYFTRLEEIIDDLLANGNQPLIVGLAPYHHVPNASSQEAGTIRSWINDFADLMIEKQVAWITPWWDLVDQATANDAIPLIRTGYTDDGGTHINIAASQMVTALIVQAYESGYVGGPWGSSFRRLR